MFSSNLFRRLWTPWSKKLASWFYEYFQIELREGHHPPQYFCQSTKGKNQKQAKGFFSKSLYFLISSVTQSCLTLCNPMDWSRPGFPIHHQLPELAPSSHWCHPTISSVFYSRLHQLLAFTHIPFSVPYWWDWVFFFLLNSELYQKCEQKHTTTMQFLCRFLRRVDQ